jgi:tetratricopeptide (TPR) repeat protein
MRSIDESNVSIDLVEGLRLYQNKNFQGSLSFFEDYMKINPESVDATFYAGMSALNIGAKENAFHLLSIVRINSEKYYEEATWVLIGIYLDRGEVENAKNFLRDLIKIENGFYVDRAKELLEKLK